MEDCVPEGKVTRGYRKCLPESYVCHNEVLLSKAEFQKLVE